MENYKPRIADATLADLLEGCGAVLIQGPKWCGKTTTAMQIAKSNVSLQEIDLNKPHSSMAGLITPPLLQGPTPRLIDEWQLAPQIWNAVRCEVDRRKKRGQFILTGSTIPYDKSKLAHSGMGRITTMKMRTMSLFESGESSGEIRLNELFEKHFDISGHQSMPLDHLAYLICRGGWPAALGLREKIALQQSVNCINATIHTDFSNYVGKARDPLRIEKLLKSYARAISTTTNLSVITRDVYAGQVEDENDPNSHNNVRGRSVTIDAYLKILTDLFFIEESDAWSPHLRSKTAIRSASTRYYTDPSLATAVLGIGPQDLMNDHLAMGMFFENLCIRDLRVYMEALDGTVYHYRDKNGLECDAILHRRNGRYGLVEIKVGGSVAIEEGMRTLEKLAHRIDTSKMPAPAFKMVITGVGEYASYDAERDILVVPINCLRN